MLANWFSNLFSVDERFIMHRYYSTRWSVLVGVIMMAVWVNYEYFVNQVLRLDLVIILAVMAGTKVLAMLYFRLTH
ncbi:MAG: hypothetical protein JSV61_05580 [Anaerolineales bacterium]|nr:MAG: hypothetical protein JSV61_05580 [Anaerolineales bacterium]